MDVDAINFLAINGHNRPRDTLTANLVVKAFALERGAGFRIGEAVDPPLGMENHGAGHHRTGKTAAADFVNACHRHETVAVEAVLDIAARGDLGHVSVHCTRRTRVTQYGD